MVAQRRQNSAFNDLYTHLRFGFIFGFSDASRDNRDAIMRCHFQVSRVKVRLITVRLGDAGAQVIGDNQFRQAAKKGEAALMRSYPVR